MAKYNNLISKLGVITKRVEHLHEVGKEAASDPANKSKVEAFIVKCEKLQGLVEQHESVVDQVMSLDKPTYKEDEFIQSLNEFDDLVANVKILCNRLIPNKVSNTTTTNSSSNPVKLPRISLKVFNGLVQDWPSFYALFQSLVEQNAALNNVERLQYLRSSLEGEALDIIKGLELVPESYQISVNLLKERYENTRKIATSHADKLMSFPAAQAPSPRHLRSLIACYREHVEALRAMGVVPKKFEKTSDGLFLFLILVRKLDPVTRCQFERSLSTNKEVPTPEDLITFIEQECHALEASTDGEKSSKRANGGRAVTLAAGTSSECMGCHTSADHRLYKCPEFLSKPVTKRRSLVQECHLCFNCLLGHLAANCPSEGRCLNCKGKHHTSLHMSRGPRGRATPDSGGWRSDRNEKQNIGQPSVVEGESATTCAASSSPKHSVILSTVLVGVQGSGGRRELIRGLLDCGSQASYITAECAQRLRLARQKTSVTVSALAQKDVLVKGAVTLHISHRLGEYATSTDAFVLDRITGNLLISPLPSEIRDKLEGLVLADPDYDLPKPIDCLIGADVFASCLKEGRKPLSGDGPFAINTAFGWVVMGQLPKTNWDSHPPVLSCHAVCETPLDREVRRFWEVEELASSTQGDCDVICENHFKSTHARSPDGRYVVRLPFENKGLKLGFSFHLARSRFLALERRLAQDKELRMLYVEFMRDYLEAGHMELVDRAEIKGTEQYYMPHLGVLKLSSSTTKLRVVFDASMKTVSNSGCSLNEMLMSGPKLQKDIVEIMLRFRAHPIVFTADIKQMFRCVWLHPEDRNYQLILWREGREEELKAYRLKTVTFGVSSSPYLAMRSLLQLVEDHGEEFKLAAKVLQQDVFVDDIVSGARSTEEARELQRELIQLLAKGGFQLRKWASNSEELISLLPESERGIPKSFVAADSSLFEILRVGWLASTDTLVYSVGSGNIIFTKRGVLSTIARFYDPLGYLAPVLFWAKCLLQHLWTLGLDWDAQLPRDLTEKWHNFTSQLPALTRVSIPRYLDSHEGEIHGFCDASERGYAAVVYFRPSSNKPCKLLLAKTKVAPLRQVSLPRLELCRAHLLSRLMEFCYKTLSVVVKVTQVWAWTDSTVTLAWIKTSPHLLKTFVANRVAEIQASTSPARWRHVPSQLNPADCASRGIYPSSLADHSLWFGGPPFLAFPVASWPENSPLMSTDELPERKQAPLHVMVTTEKELSLSYLDRFSSWMKLLGVTVYVIRFINNTRHPDSPRAGTITALELRLATTLVIRAVQVESFGVELAQLQAGKLCRPGIQQLAPFLDAAHLLRVGGRVGNACLEYNAKHPILLPKNHAVTKPLIDFFHRTYLHAGPHTVQSMISRHYWILSCRAEVRKYIRQCVTCFRNKPYNTVPPMADLPSFRVQRSRVFSSVHLDYAGPFLSKPHRRSNTRCKLYLCLFVCSSTKAVHLEAVSDMSTAAFIAALQRFIARRGLCAHIHSDCGSNLVGASRELKRVFDFVNSPAQRERFSAFASSQGINWHFQPPSAPHFGGLHEAAIRLAKHHLRRVIGHQILTYEEYATVFARVEAILNSRPLCPLSEDPAESDTLTPGHFLVGGPLVALPDNDMPRSTPLTRWKLTCKLAHHFWRRWSQEYLHTLIQRSKWYRSSDNLRIGQMVLLQEDNLPPQEWRLARVANVNSGKDGVVRVVRLTTGAGDLTRPAVKVFPLPIV